MPRTQTLDTLDSLPESTLRELCLAGATHEIMVVGLPRGGFAVRVAYGVAGKSAKPLDKVLATSRGGIRRFASIDTAAGFVREFGVLRFGVDMTDHEPGPVRGPRPDRAEALRKTKTKPTQGSLLS